MKYFGENAFSHLAQLLKNTFAKIGHTHTKSEISDYKDYELPTASADTLGGVKVGDGLTITDGVLSATSPLKDKKITVIGDSLSTGYTVGKNWVNMLATRTGAIVTNLATDGATIAYRDDDNGNNFISKLSSVPTDSDYVVVMGGGNDMMESISVGSRFEVDNTYVVSGALFQIIVYLQTNLPNTKIMFITEPPIGSEIHEAYDPYLNIILEICAYCHIPCFNMTNNFGLNPTIPQVREIYWLSDYVHLTVKGQEYMSAKIQKFLENEFVNNNKNATTLNGYKLSILTATEYVSLSTKDENTIYITKDQKAYLGSTLILGGGDGEDTSVEGTIDAELWSKFFNVKSYGNNAVVINSNPTITFEGSNFGWGMANLSEENAVYEDGASITHNVMTLSAGQALTINLDYEATNIAVTNMTFYWGGGYTYDVTSMKTDGSYELKIVNSSGGDAPINGVAFYCEPTNQSLSSSIKLTIKSITIA